MECYIPLDSTISNTDYEALNESHNKRQFVIFDEQLKLVLHSTNNSDDDRNVALKSFSVWINDSMMLESTDMSLFDVDATQNCWIMKPTVCAEQLFRSTVVMNNAYDNNIKFKVQYGSIDRKSNGTIKNSKHENTDDEENEYLPNFEPIHIWSQVHNKNDMSIAPVKEEEPTNGDQEVTTLISSTEEPEELTLEFPIYSLLNMRLRNTSLHSKQHIISSLDFQTSKAATQLSDRYSMTNGNNTLEFKFDEVRYSLLDRNSHIRLDPIVPLEIPFKAQTHDSFSICYKLPLLNNSSNNIPHRVRVKLIYKIIISMNQELKACLPVLTSWETDVTIKKPVDNSVLSRVASTSVLSTPKLVSNSKRFPSLATHLNHSIGNFPTTSNGNLLYNSSNNLQQNSMTSLINNKMDNVKFKFLNNNLQVMKGEKFHMRLQIVNSSNIPLDLVVYYNNNKNSSLALGSSGSNGNNINNSFATLPPTKQYQIYRKFSKVTEGIILLSNDYKVPIIQPKQTYFVDLSFIAIMSGYYSTLSALKVLDLQTNELIEVGLGASILVK
ncbi:similar to Saccharomyces cerevisiae YGR166W TRS65 Subunit of TRAPPII, a multimeric guanine nucleotide-exchange factor for Ypt1p [Maudiozyma barnettii]|uniref:Similar to Saccharomyces cerevisiae YGR166W TRS65 Subunit of TRAPPII, a multimeric guanine nucleotide-exchange factor for Ypt1p n=1 Tax=Maudiozyma barnettii TaxID=61262 RepID=A0A8H2VGZ9_9SACH|nr:Trs65p [Kazachstania barnettii]CAB4255285.1 similar to Saccharomyces cerevisiae YGR166W TRS65 Subunit of TRAPPII, a multimeric guanine nucleotide-exchange factor for Ypt1p [Kazachstania barnettii]CAD1783692.1 similar to Saccharomyces cerevisiae YGR166W TRS65 Subunit of TRAPPII, a multimeric guanine nucleotide-exchange factor for Ypt1p [Kazachstania barnettii]